MTMFHLIGLWWSAHLLNVADALLPDIPETEGARAKIRSCAQEIDRALAGDED